MGASGLTLVILFFMASVCARTECTPLDFRRWAEVALSVAGRGCVSLSVAGQEAVQLEVEQPVDVRLRRIGNAAASAVDGFEFGTETITIGEAGRHTVEIEPAGALKQAVRIVVRLTPVAPEAVPARRAAEESATRAKRSGKLPDIEAALELWLRLGDESATRRLEIAKGEALAGTADLEAARTAFQLALAQCQAASDTRCSAAAANDGGWTAQQLGDFEQARALLEEAVTDWDRLGDLRRQGQTLSNLGLLFRQTGDYQQAIAYYDRAGNLLRSRDRVSNARVTNNLGICYQFLAEYDQARRHFESALRDFTIDHSPRDAVRTRLNLGRNDLLEGRHQTALNILNLALAEATVLADAAARADTLDNLGQAMLAVGRNEDGRKALRESLNVHRKSGDKKMEAQDIYYLGVADEKSGRIAEARENFQKSYAIRRASGLRDTATDSLFALVELEQREGRVDRARELATQGLGLMEAVRANIPGPELRASFYARQRRFIDLLVDLEMAAGVENGFLAVERGRGRALMDLVVEGQVTEPLPGDLLIRKTGVQRRIDLLAARISAAGGGQAEDLRGRIEKLVSEDEEIEARTREVISRKVSEPLGSVAQLQRGLPRDSAVLEYHLAEPRSYLWLVEPGSIQSFVLPSRPEIEKQCAPVLKLFPEILERRRSPAAEQRFRIAVAKLSATLLGPAGQRGLPPRLILAPDGVLNRVPFAALDLPGQKKLGLVHDLVQVPAAGYLIAGRRPRETGEFPQSILALADPVYSERDARVHPPTKVGAGNPVSDLARLPFTAELDLVRLLVPVSRRRILVGFDASAEVLKKAELEDFAFLELSTHALIDDRMPELSRVALSMVGPEGQKVDGFLRSYHLSHLRLNGSTVVLSACETALGKQVIGEGLMGLTTSLFSAGAAQLLLTISPVDAEGSSEFLREVYRNVFGKRPAATEHALTLARQALARSPRWADPYYWASFAIYGRPFEESE